MSWRDRKYHAPFLVAVASLILTGCAAATDTQHYAAGIELQIKGSLDEAVVEFTEAIRQDPDNPKAYVRRGFVYLEQGDFDRALQDAMRAEEAERRAG